MLPNSFKKYTFTVQHERWNVQNNEMQSLAKEDEIDVYRMHHGLNEYTALKVTSVFQHNVVIA